MEQNGVTRREFEDARADIRDLRREVARLEREGSAATKRLADRVDDHRDDIADVKDFNKWLVRGMIASVLIALAVAFVLQGSGH